LVLLRGAGVEDTGMTWHLKKDKERPGKTIKHMNKKSMENQYSFSAYIRLQSLTISVWKASKKSGINILPKASLLQGFWPNTERTCS